MGQDWVLWILVTAAALHVVEEHGMGWQGWAAGVFGVSAAAVGWRAPAFALAFPAVCLVNAVFFRFLPSISARRPNPGLLTALLLYLPLGVWAYCAAAEDDVLSVGTLVLSAALGAAARASVVVVLALQPRLRYPDAER
jgi:Protein of unknown function with HXXEE motif